MKYLALALSALFLLIGCGGGGGASPPPSSKTLSSIVVTTTTPTLAAGHTAQMTAMAGYSDGSQDAITTKAAWSSSDSSVAVIDANGKLTALKAGVVDVSSVWSGQTGKARITVTSPVAESLRIDGSRSEFPVGATSQFAATATMSDGTSVDMTAQVNWSTSNNLASVAGLGAVVGVGAGSSEVRVACKVSTACGTLTATHPISITPAALIAVALTLPNGSMAAGSSQQARATATYSDGSTLDVTTQSVWTSSQPAVASINAAGMVQAIAAGTAALTATIDGITSPAASVTVGPAQLVSMSISPMQGSVPVGLTLQFHANGTYSDGSHQDLTNDVFWSTSVAAAEISNAPGKKGQATGKYAASMLLVYAKLGSVEATPVALEVSSAVLQSIRVSAANVDLIPMATTQMTAMGSFSDASQQDITNQVDWSSAAPTKVQVSNVNPSKGAVTLSTTALVGDVVGVTAKLGAITAQQSLRVVKALSHVHVVTYYEGNLMTFGLAADGGMVSLGSVKTGIEPRAITASANAANLFVANGGAGVPINMDGSIGVYAVDQTGRPVLSQSQPAAVNAWLSDARISPTGNILFTTTMGPKLLSSYRVGVGGALQLLSMANTATTPWGITTHPNGRFVYVLNGGDNVISSFTVAADGTLAAVPGGLVATGAKPSAAVMDRLGKYLYVANSDENTISQYAIDATGFPIPLSTARVTTVTSPGSLVIDPSGRFLYAGSRDNRGIGQFAIGSDGRLTPLAPANVQAPDDNLSSMVFDASGTYLLVAMYDGGGLAQYKVGASGQLIFVRRVYWPISGGAQAMVAVNPP